MKELEQVLYIEGIFGSMFIGFILFSIHMLWIGNEVTGLAAAVACCLCVPVIAYWDNKRSKLWKHEKSSNLL